MQEAAAQMVDRFRFALRSHWLTHIECDHEAKTDRPVCSCSLWRGPVKPNVGEAVEAWIDHVTDQVLARKE